jgi:YHS domain-containing protein
MKPLGRILIYFSIIFLFTTGFNNITAGESLSKTVAIKGYDSVAYFTEGKAVKGDEHYTFQWNGMVWYFSNKENKELFVKKPENYAPQYDGYCAWAMTEARKAATDPEFWKIVNGKLYLNCNKAAHERWSRDIPGNIKKADDNWRKFSAAT